MESVNDAVSLVWGKVTGWGEGFLRMLPNLVVAVLVVIGFVLLARLAARLVQRALDRVMHNTQIAHLLAALVRVGVIVAGTFVALGILDLDKTVTSLLAGVGIVGLALGFAFQDLAANFISGIIMSVRRPFRVGELVEIAGVLGVVQGLDLRATHLRKPNGEDVILPNKKILEEAIINHTHNPEIRVDLPVGVAYGDDLEKVKRVTLQSMEGHATRLKDRDVELFYTEFGDSSINFILRFWIPYSGRKDYHAARSEAVMRIKAAFDANDITIPFPIRTLDFGVVGGERLDEIVPHFAIENGERGRPEAPAA